MINSKQKIVVGLSGGVDSAVTALLLKQQGHDVMGIFMQNWDAERDDPHCTAEQDLSDARAICDQIGIALHTANFVREYWDRVFQHCLDEFAAGRTPNPDIWCNREIKFNVFLQHALNLGAQKLATGHYTRIQQGKEGYQLLRGLDPSKDQAYFLYTLNQFQLQHSLFPVGELLKSDVRKIAQQHGLMNYAKKDSTGICFIGEREFKPFLQEFLLAQPGDIETIEGKKLGKHDGIMFYTLGQRKGLNIGGIQNTDEKPWYVLQKDVKRNVLIVGQGYDHPLLYSRSLTCCQADWICGHAPKTPATYVAKTRHLQPDQRCHLSPITENTFHVEFENPQRAITPGQSIVFYEGDVCLGGAIITENQYSFSDKYFGENDRAIRSQPSPSLSRRREREARK
ncbi:MAG: tRNA 2-thiouridine(34) synthase MnmA [Gammaproteobacteria bacterium RIFCSPHIGHO2_12_FULL_41_15]|nr:MAG: tRNA 2-thiouridine(34) synthase MnmA [Gammaproteobacteria bacterium RIFCSPHIGHO2_12_FULL_41_15]